jgi:acetyltransferase-like isoleucine patch superfamily enzyme
MIESFLLKVRRGETPFYKRLRNLAIAVRDIRLPTPGIVLPLIRLVFLTYHGMFRITQGFLSFFIREPMFRSRCVTFGKHVRVSRLPFIVGQPKIYVGNNVNFFGKVDIFSGRLFDEPTLILKDRVDIGHGVGFLVNRQITIEEDVNVASGVHFMDSDAHPRDTAERIADKAPPLEEIKPVRICRNAWIGHNSFIMKGVTVGEGAIIGVNSVVVTDVPPYCVAMGNPARVVVKGLKPPPDSVYATAARAEDPSTAAL